MKVGHILRGLFSVAFECFKGFRASGLHPWTGLLSSAWSPCGWSGRNRRLLGYAFVLHETV